MARRAQAPRTRPLCGSTVAAPRVLLGRLLRAELTPLLERVLRRLVCPFVARRRLLRGDHLGQRLFRVRGGKERRILSISSRAASVRSSPSSCGCRTSPVSFRCDSTCTLPKLVVDDLEVVAIDRDVDGAEPALVHRQLTRIVSGLPC